MKIVIDSREKVRLTLSPKTRDEAITQQLYIIIKTILGECPMYREFGTENSFLHLPATVSQNRFISAVSEAIRKFEPDVTLSNVRFENGSEYGETQICKIEVTLNE